MTNEQSQVRDWMLSVGQSCPSKPTIPSLEVRKLRAKLILEEALETIAGLGLSPIFTDTQDGQMFDTHGCKIEFETMGVVSLCEIADGCEDLKVVTEGTLVACGLLDHSDHFIDLPEWPIPYKSVIDPLFREVIRSNFSKFLTPDEFSQQVESNSSNPNWLPHTVYTDDTKQTIKYIVVKDASGKVMKGPSYSAPNLQPIIDEMSK